MLMLLVCVLLRINIQKYFEMQITTKITLAHQTQC
jgi:hypothetical protein